MRTWQFLWKPLTSCGSDDSMKSHNRPLNDYAAAVSESTEVRRGVPLPLGAHESTDKRSSENYAGTGNTINANHPVVRDHILAALRSWVLEMRVDGFRFDLASVLDRDGTGRLLANASVLERIAEDPILRDVKLIAEAWDAAGAYEVGSFSERRWAEWNGRFRDDVRRFWRGDEGMLRSFASRICGSSDIYAGSGRGPECSINFVTCHDGFTLNDLVSYREKHNEANGESNHDGTNENLSGNCGAEGDTADAPIEPLRVRQIKNFLLTLLTSRGVPMVLGGDEFRRTQGGNNNAYNQDNETSWYDWRFLARHRGIFRFTREMIAFRRAHTILSKERFYTEAEIQWFDQNGGLPDWSDPKARQLACLVHEEGFDMLYLIFNAGSIAVDFHVPAAPKGAPWRLSVDTSHEAPRDVFSRGEEPILDSAQVYSAGSHCSVILVSRSPGNTLPEGS
jgi:isoamylase